MDINNLPFVLRGRYYTTAEKNSLASGNFETASEICKARHSSQAIDLAFRRYRDLRFNANGIPRTLDRLCLKLRIRYLRESTPAYSKGTKSRRRQNEVISFLASLPNAENYREEHWLDTPELWPFVNLEKIRNVNGDSCENLAEELRRRIGSWCDRWIPYSSTALPGMKPAPENIYLFPFYEDLRSDSLPRSRKRYLLNNTFMAYSQARKRKEPLQVSEPVRSGVIDLSRKMSIGYTSFKCGVTVADVLEIMKEDRDEFRKNPESQVQKEIQLIGCKQPETEDH